MEDKIFLDTNIILDFLDKNRKNNSLAMETMQFLILNDYKIFISDDMLSTIYYINKDKKKTLMFFRDILDIFNIVYFDKEIISESLDIAIKNSCDLEDTLQCVCAKQNKCKFILTNDKKFVECGVEIINYDYFKQFLST